jgi:hypothetical protein
VELPLSVWIIQEIGGRVKAPELPKKKEFLNSEMP